jgi:hypothetical protein
VTPTGRRAFLLALTVLAGGAARAAVAQAPAGLEGTWGGAKGDLTAQVIVAGGAVVGFFWRGDYLDTRGSALSADGASLAFAFAGGKALLARTGARTASLEIIEGGRTVRLELQRD